MLFMRVSDDDDDDDEDDDDDVVVVVVRLREALNFELVALNRMDVNVMTGKRWLFDDSCRDFGGLESAVSMGVTVVGFTETTTTTTTSSVRLLFSFRLSKELH